MNRAGPAAIAALLVVAAGQAASAPTAGPAWAHPPGGPPATAPFSKTRMVSPPGVATAKPEAEAHDMSHAVDWRPGEHPAMPPAVGGTGRKGAMACGYCHMPEGQGRPENAALAGLPASYITAQVAAFASGTRAIGAAPATPPSFMKQASATVTAAEIAAAADYYSRLKFTSRVKVLERATIPKMDADHYIYHPAKGGGSEPLGLRIVEAPENMEGFELRDGHMAYTAYAPPGAIMRGRLFASNRGSGGKGQICQDCHGAGLKGMTTAPPLAGRSPSYIFRQLYAIQTGGRTDAGSEPMRAIVKPMTVADMIDVAAYAGSLKP